MFFTFTLAGTLYESCNQLQDSLDAYQHAAELDPQSVHIQQRILAIKNAMKNGGTTTAAANSTNNAPSNSTAATNSIGNNNSPSKDMVPGSAPPLSTMVKKKLELELICANFSMKFNLILFFFCCCEILKSRNRKSQTLT